MHNMLIIKREKPLRIREGGVSAYPRIVDSRMEYICRVLESVGEAAGHGEEPADGFGLRYCIPLCLVKIVVGQIVVHGRA